MNRRGFLAAIAGACVAPAVPQFEPFEAAIRIHLIPDPLMFTQATWNRLLQCQAEAIAAAVDQTLIKAWGEWQS